MEEQVRPTVIDYKCDFCHHESIDKVSMESHEEEHKKRRDCGHIWAYRCDRFDPRTIYKYCTKCVGDEFDPESEYDGCVISMHELHYLNQEQLGQVFDLVTTFENKAKCALNIDI